MPIKTVAEIIDCNELVRRKTRAYRLLVKECSFVTLPYLSRLTVIQAIVSYLH